MIDIINHDRIVVYDFSNLNLEETSKGNCFGCDVCDCDCNCDCDNCDSCNNCDCDVCDNKL